MSIEGEVFKSANGRTTLRFVRQAKSYFLKAHRGVGWREVFKNLLQLRLPVVSARNEWRAIRRLKTLDIDTMHAVGYGCRGWNPARLRSFIVTEDLGHTVSLDRYCRDWRDAAPSPAEKRTLIRKVASIARRLHENGVNHRDFYLCHLRLHPISDANACTDIEPRVYVMDLHRAQLRRHTPRRWKIKDLAGLYFSSMDIGLTQRDLLRFMRIYRGKPLAPILDAEAAFWENVRDRACRLYDTSHHKQKP
ncbi:MAG: lipopolysaccharide core heptose(I) kinase RfaP [Burkholderiales bacterium]